MNAVIYVCVAKYVTHNALSTADHHNNTTIATYRCKENGKLNTKGGECAIDDFTSRHRVEGIWLEAVICERIFIENKKWHSLRMRRPIFFLHNLNRSEVSNKSKLRACPTKTHKRKNCGENWREQERNMRKKNNI